MLSCYTKGDYLLNFAPSRLKQAVEVLLLFGVSKDMMREKYLMMRLQPAAIRQRLQRMKDAGIVFAVVGFLFCQFVVFFFVFFFFLRSWCCFGVSKEMMCEKYLMMRLQPDAVTQRLQRMKDAGTFCAVWVLFFCTWGPPSSRVPLRKSPASCLNLTIMEWNSLPPCGPWFETRMA
jgi:hypothetical protein